MRIGGGLGTVALAGLLGRAAAGASSQQNDAVVGNRVDKGLLTAGPLPARAKRVIWIHHYGAPSQVDTFDYKPMLEKMHGQEMPRSVMEKSGVRVSGMTSAQSSFPLIKSLAPFSQHGESGAWVSGLLPYQAKIADDLCFIKSLWTEHVNHDPAGHFLFTGSQLQGRPSTGAWVSFALGTDNADLPNFVVLNSMGLAPNGLSVDLWGPGFLASKHQGVQFRSSDEPVLYVDSPAGVSAQMRQAEFDTIRKLSELQYAESGDPEIQSKISQYEMAAHMQLSVPEVSDLSKEPKHILDMYGPDVQRPNTFAKNCLLARRLIERGVKFVQIVHNGWDHHNAIARTHPIDCASTDQPSAALVMDLKQRGMLDDTLIVAGGEFGRTPFAQGVFTAAYGRDHHGGCFTTWMAGAGVNAGHSIGETDDFAFNIVKDPHTIHDLHATVLHILGIEHEKLTYHYQGRDFRLTDVSGTLIKPFLS